MFNKDQQGNKLLKHKQYLYRFDSEKFFHSEMHIVSDA